MSELTRTDGSTAASRFEGTREQQRYVTPAVDIYESEKGLTLLADMPGAVKEQIDVTVDNGVLTIKAGVPEMEEQKAAYCEYRMMNYFRQFELGETIDQDKIGADYSNGVLKLNLPIAEKAKPRKIQVSLH